MSYIYGILINHNLYTPIGLIDNNATIKWEQGDNGRMRRKQIDGSFILSRANNEGLYDRILALTHCDKCYIRVYDQDYTLIVESAFSKRTIDYNAEKCNITIKPYYYDRNGIDAIMDKDYNIINSNLTRYTLEFDTNYQFEFKTCTAQNVPILAPYFTNGVIDVKADCANDGGVCPDSSCYTGDNYLQFGWTFFSQRSVKVGDIPGVAGGYFDIETTWFREVKLVPLAVDPNQTPPPKGGSQFDFDYWGQETINGNIYNKYVRNVDSYAAVENIAYNYVSSYYGKQATRYVTRARRLNEILEHFKDELGCTSLHSDFFKNNVNPVSGRDLTNLMLVQKSDAIFIDGAETTDPARLGIITLRQLMEQLWSMFQVTWDIVDDVLYIEHIDYFRNNFSYTLNTTVGLDLTVDAPRYIEGTYIYSFDNKLPIREKFKFMEAWNLDFVGTDIEYTNCLTDGGTETYSAELITTDVDTTYLDNEASKDGFVLFHTEKIETVIGIITAITYVVAKEVGALTGIDSYNAHLSWANLHDSYWKSNRYLDSGIMNGQETTFVSPLRKLKKQIPLEFPFCVENVDDIINNKVRTTMGDGDIVSAEYSFKSGFLKIELTYD